MASHIGSLVEISTTMGNYKGVLHNVNQEDNGPATRVTLAHVVSLPDKKKLPGTHHFFREDIKNLILLKEKKEVKVVKTDGSQGGKSLLRNKETPEHLKRLRALDRQKMFAYRPSMDSEQAEVIRPETFHGQMSCRLPNVPSMKYTIFYNTGVDFRKAVDDIKRHKLIGLAAEGSCLGRNGLLLWLQIALPNECFLFDMKIIGPNSAFTSGLQDILESPNIQKVIHNCRNLSDYLHHKHNMKIVNVFDTQVADVLVYRNEHRGDLPRFVHSISQVVPACVKLEVEEVYKARARAATQAKDEMRFWGGPRPPSEEVVETAMFNVMYLLALYHHLMDKLFEPLRTGVDVFLRSLRDCSDSQYQQRKDSNHLVPNEFADLARLNLRGDEVKFVENDHLMPDPHIVFSHDSVSHIVDPEFDTRMEQLRTGRPRSHIENQRGRLRSKSVDAQSPGRKAEDARTTSRSSGDTRKVVDTRRSSRSPGDSRRVVDTSGSPPDSKDSLLALGASGRQKQQQEQHTRPTETLITDVHPTHVKANVQTALDQPFVPTPTAARPVRQTRLEKENIFRASGAESTDGQYPLKERKEFTRPARKADDSEEWGNIPDHQKCFPNERSRMVDWDLKEQRREAQKEERKDEGFHSRGNSDEDNGSGNRLVTVVSDGHASDSALVVKDSATPARAQSRSPNAGLPTGRGRGQALLRLAGLVSPPEVGKAASSEVKKPMGRAAILNTYGGRS